MGRQVREEQSRPYVMVSAGESPASREFIDIVIKNIGSTPAHDLTIKVDPPLVAARPGGYPLAEAHIFKETISTWPPGYEFRVFFGSHIERRDKELPTTHDVTVTYTGGRRGRTRRPKRWVETMTIDLNLSSGATYVEIYGTHHAAKALKEIAALLKKAEVLKRGQLEVTTETREQRTDRLTDEREKRSTEPLTDALAPGTTGDADVSDT
ncbi:MAG: hypothetical protein ACRCXL_15100 [Dermatophilaceae bacterium]